MRNRGQELGGTPIKVTENPVQVAKDGPFVALAARCALSVSAACHRRRCSYTPRLNVATLLVGAP